MTEEHFYFLEDCTACRRLVLVPKSKLDRWYQASEEPCRFCPHPHVFEHEHDNYFGSRWIASWKWDGNQQRYRVLDSWKKTKLLKPPEPCFNNLQCKNLEKGEDSECTCDNKRRIVQDNVVCNAIIWRKQC